MGRLARDIVCTVCGCVCDDLALRIEGASVTGVEQACPLAEPWLLSQTAADVPAAHIAGTPVSLDAAIARAAQILDRAKAPLIYGLSRSSTPGQRAAVRLADRLSGLIDTTASTCHAPSIMAVQNIGESTSTLGEVRNRSDLVVYWGSNPVISHPRHIERIVEAPGLHIPNGRAGRRLVVVDTKPTETSELADTFIQVERGRDFDLLWALRTCLQGLPLEAPTVAGVTRETIEAFVAQLRSCQYGVFFFGLGLTGGSVPHANIEALLRLATDLNDHTRFVVRRMRVPGDVTGADSVLCWQTGFPFSVNLTRGYPRYNPGEYTANVLLERGEVDAVLLVGSEGIPKLSPAARACLETVPTIVLDYPMVDCPTPAEVTFTTAVYGIHRPGTAYRMDEVPLELKQLIESPLPSDEEVLQAICRGLSPEEGEV